MRTKLIAIVVVQLWLGATRPLWAQSSIVPSVAFHRVGGWVCPTAQNCEDKMPSLGPSVGTMRGVPGFEDDFWAREPFGRTPEAGRVFVLSGSSLVARVTPRISARFAPDGNPLRFWRGTFGVVVRF